jgi:hypothetical protein
MRAIGALLRQPVLAALRQAREQRPRGAPLRGGAVARLDLGMLEDRFGVTWVLDVATEYKTP